MKRLAILTNMVAPYRAPVYEHLAQRFETTIFASGHEDNREWGTQHNVWLRVKSVRGFVLKTSMLSSKGRIAEQRYMHVHPGYAWELVRFRPDAIISIEMGVRSAIAIVYGLLFRKPVWILWLGGVHTNRVRGSSSLRRALRRFFFLRFVKHWWSMGDVSTDYLVHLGVPRERIVQTQNPVRESLFGPDGPRYPVTSSHPRVLFIGRLIENKGIYQLLSIAGDVRRDGYRFSLIVVGDGPERKEFEAQAVLHNLPLEWIRWVPPEETASVYRAADFLIFPTLDDVWGVVVNEALLCGLPVAASKYAGCAAELLPSQNVFDPLDPVSFKAVFIRGLRGQLAPPAATQLKSAREVAETISAAIERELG